MTKSRIVTVAGPTASGKSALALALARELGGVIINADSMQVYRELAILTARPTAEDEAKAPHALYGVLSVREACSAGRWVAMAKAAIAEAEAAGRLPILVGGTGLYLKALTEGIAEIPAIPEAIRQTARTRTRDLGLEAFRAEVAARDPEWVERIAPGDTQRLTRAWEVVEATGRPLSDWLKAQEQPRDAPSAFTVLLDPPRAALRGGIAARFDAMMAAGALEEARRISALALDDSLPATRALGLRELRRHLAGEIDLATAITEAKTATTRYAKRQATWFRHQIRADHVIAPQHIDRQFSERFLPEILSKIRRLVLTPWG